MLTPSPRTPVAPDWHAPAVPIPSFYRFCCTRPSELLDVVRAALRIEGPPDPPGGPIARLAAGLSSRSSYVALWSLRTAERFVAVSWYRRDRSRRTEWRCRVVAADVLDTIQPYLGVWMSSTTATDGCPNLQSMLEGILGKSSVRPLRTAEHYGALDVTQIIIVDDFKLKISSHFNRPLRDFTINDWTTAYPFFHYAQDPTDALDAIARLKCIDVTTYTVTDNAIRMLGQLLPKLPYGEAEILCGTTDYDVLYGKLRVLKRRFRSFGAHNVIDQICGGLATAMQQTLNEAQKFDVGFPKL